jgi:ERCC4-type nuclease
MSHILLDTREFALMPLLTESTVKSLHAGDAIVACGDRRVVIERKTIADLIASIHDGRFHEQFVRLAVENAPVVYIIENSRGGIPPEHRKKVSSALGTLAVHKGFYVLHSESVEQTAELIQALAHKVGTAEAVA